MSKKWYSVCRDVTSSDGWQEFKTYASSKEEALHNFENGFDTFLSEEIEVTCLSDISLRDIIEHEEEPEEENRQDDIIEAVKATERRVVEDILDMVSYWDEYIPPKEFEYQIKQKYTLSGTKTKN